MGIRIDDIINKSIFTVDDIRTINESVHEQLEEEFKPSFKDILPIVYENIFKLMENWLFYIGKEMTLNRLTATISSHIHLKNTFVGLCRSYAETAEFYKNRDICTIDPRVLVVITNIFERVCNLSNCEITSEYDHYSKNILCPGVLRNSFKFTIKVKWSLDHRIYNICKGPIRYKTDRFFDIPSTEVASSKSVTHGDASSSSSSEIGE